MDDAIDEKIRKLDLVDGDCIVITSPRTLRMEAAERIRSSLMTVIDRLGVKVQAIILDDGMDIKVLRTSDLPKAD